MTGSAGEAAAAATDIYPLPAAAAAAEPQPSPQSSWIISLARLDRAHRGWSNADAVAAIITRLGAPADFPVDCPDGVRRPLQLALSSVVDIDRPSAAAIEVLASRAPDYDESQRLQALAEGYPGAQPEDADLLGLLLAFPSARPPVQELVAALDLLPLQAQACPAMPPSPSPVVLTRSAGDAAASRQLSPAATGLWARLRGVANIFSSSAALRRET